MKTRFVDTLAPGDIVGAGFTFVKKQDDLVYPNGHNKIIADFQCPHCDNIKYYVVDTVKNKQTISCGCFKKQRQKKSKRSADSPIYTVWTSMRQRCYDKNATNYPRYGGKGATVCQRWSGSDGFKNFELDMLPKYKPGLQLDKDIRFPGNMEYSRLMCQWVTPQVNYQNRISTLYCLYLGEYMKLEDASKLLGLNHNTCTKYWAQRKVPKKYQHLVEIVERQNVI